MTFVNGMSPVEMALSFLSVMAFLGYAGAMVVYALFAPWQRTAVGRLMLFFFVVTTFSFVLILFLRQTEWAQDYRDAIRLFIFSGFALAGVGLFIAVLDNWRLNAKAYRERKALSRKIRDANQTSERRASKMAETVNAVPSTQVQFPNRSMWRTMVQTAIPAVIGLVVLLPWVIEMVVATYGDTLPPEVRTWMLGAAAFITVTAGLVAKIMANPAVDLWIRTHIKKLAPSVPEAQKPEPVVVEPQNPEPAVPQEPEAESRSHLVVDDDPPAHRKNGPAL